MVEEQIAYGRREKMGAEIPLPRGHNQERERNNCHDLLSIISWKRGTKIRIMKDCLPHCLLVRHPFPYALGHNTVPCLIRYLYRTTFYVHNFCEDGVSAWLRNKLLMDRQTKNGAEIPLLRGHNQERKEITAMISCP
ncbi:hypothetical protein CEXT_451731 [Caerostris extrusa]|uniref:Uncharacterized protein n=1 Tax=Caerostris extrusa TaxID=172846 RepID=A0AAV4TJ10_CAEEX|nr:hypothetical protein CEXT_451731 [Caerostris extrusa]